MLDKKPNEYVKSSVWAVNSRYYIDGKSISIPSGLFQTADTDAISAKLKKYESEIKESNRHLNTMFEATQKIDISNIIFIVTAKVIFFYEKRKKNSKMPSKVQSPMMVFLSGKDHRLNLNVAAIGQAVVAVPHLW